MNLVWINESTARSRGGTNTTTSGSTRQTRQVEAHASRRKRLAGRRTSATIPGIENNDDSSGAEIVDQTEDGSTIFLITHQRSADAKKSSSPEKKSPSQSPKSHSPTVCIDSICSSTVTLNSAERVIIEYIASTWFPASKVPQPMRHWGAFSLVWPGDGQYSVTMLRPAFQMPDSRSLFSLMAVASRKLPPNIANFVRQKATTDSLSLKAVQSLRKSIAGKEAPTDQLVMDLSLLVLAELLTKTPQHIAGIDIYWNMVRDAWVAIGGILNTRPMVVSFVTSIDCYCALVQVTVPKVDVWSNHALLGLNTPSQASSPADSEDLTANKDDFITSALSQLDMRSQVTLEGVKYIRMLAEAIQRLPEPALPMLRSYLQDHYLEANYNIGCPLSPQTAKVSHIVNAPNHAAADIAHFFARFYGCVIWWWYCAVNFLPNDVKQEVQTPPIVHVAISQAWRLIDQVRSLLEAETWYTASNLVFWISAAGCLVVKNEDDWREYHRILIHTAKERGIDSEERVNIVLTGALSLTMLDTMALQRIWDLLTATFGRT